MALIRVKQINNLKIMQDKDTKNYLVFTPDGRRVYCSNSLKDVESQCKVHKEFLNKPVSSDTYTLKVNFVDDEEFGTVFVFTVPKRVTSTQLRNALQEAIDIIYKLYMNNEVTLSEEITKNKVEIAKRAFREYDASLDAYLYYVDEVYGWHAVCDEPVAFTMNI